MFLLIPASIYADDKVETLAKNWFTTFSKKISLKYSQNKEILYLEWFSTKLNDLLVTRNFTDTQINLVNNLIELSNERVFNIKLSNTENSAKIILKTNSLLKDFRYFSYNDEHIFLENWIWYTYKFDEVLFFTKWKIITIDSLKASNINANKSLVILNEDSSLWFVNNYTKVKLISDDIIYGIPDKFNFLKEIKDDKKKITFESDSSFITLKKLTKNITNWKNESEKIKLIYNYILKNIEYNVNFSLNDDKIFSWIDTFQNKSWVCEGYAKVLLYMINFAWINDSEVIRWDVLDAQDFPQIWHAWVKIRDKYYDPTFDDPIGQVKTLGYSEYKYFWLPYDLFYTNRYAYGKLPSYLKTESLEYRTNFINKRLSPLVEKYKNSNYNILKPFIFKLDNWIDINKSLNIEDLKKIIKYYEVNNLKFTENGITKSIESLMYYVIDDSKTDSLIEQINYNIDGYYLFKWKLDNWTYEYRLAYDVIFR